VFWHIPSAFNVLGLAVGGIVVISSLRRDGSAGQSCAPRRTRRSRSTRVCAVTHPSHDLREPV